MANNNFESTAHYFIVGGNEEFIAYPFTEDGIEAATLDPGWRISSIGILWR